MTTYMAQFDVNGPSVTVTIINRDNARTPVFEGRGSCVHDAISHALQPQRVAFKSEQDELDACVAAMRSKSLLFSVLHDGAMVSNGFR